MDDTLLDLGNYPDPKQYYFHPAMEDVDPFYYVGKFKAGAVNLPALAALLIPDAVEALEREVSIEDLQSLIGHTVRDWVQRVESVTVVRRSNSISITITASDDEQEHRHTLALALN